MTSSSARDTSQQAASAPTLRAGRHTSAIIRVLLIAALLLAADLVMKHYAFERVAGQPVDISTHGENGLSAIPFHESRTVLPRILALRLTLNQGAVFGLGQGYRWVFIVISVFAVIVIGTVFYRSRPDDLLLHVALAMVLSGALGNLYDRVVYGMVRDMLYLFPDVNLPFGWSWPGGDTGLYPWIFNIADVALLSGMMLLFIHVFRAEMHHRRADQEQSPDTSGK